ncbi:MAG: hypothetical protein WC581_03380 [Thermodesulfovibrionales bacterium]
MKKTISTLIILLSILLFGVSSFGAVDVTLLNQTFVRDTGKPITESINFVGAVGKAKIKVFNGGLEGSAKISSAAINVNGLSIFKESDFNQKVSYLEKTVNLSEGQNIMKVVLKSKPGGKINIQIIQVIEAEAAAVIGPEGGIMTIEDPDSLLNGTMIEIPANALSAPKIITISRTNLSTSLPEGTVDAGPFINFGPDGTQFQGIVYVTIPYEDKDNDGIMDYSDVPENELKVVTYDRTTQTWNEQTIINQDIELNTVTFVTNHFSDYVAMIFSACTDPVFIFTIDGLKFSEFNPFSGGDDLETSYLRRAILDMGLLKKKSCVVSYSGSSNFTLRWDGDANNTEKIMADLNNTLKTYYNKATETNKKFILVTHSWGTILGQLALKYNYDINPDLFITLSSPLYTLNAVSPSNAAKATQALISDFTVDKIEDTYKKLGQPSRLVGDFNFKWINYWAWGDLISGPINLTKSTFRNDRVDANYDSARSIDDTLDWHFVTTIDEKTMAHVLWNAYGKTLFKEVKSEILVFTLPGDFCCLFSGNVNEIMNEGINCFNGKETEKGNGIYGAFCYDLDAQDYCSDRNVGCYEYYSWPNGIHATIEGKGGRDLTFQNSYTEGFFDVSVINDERFPWVFYDTDWISIYGVNSPDQITLTFIDYEKKALDDDNLPSMLRKDDWDKILFQAGQPFCEIKGKINYLKCTKP